MTNFSSVGHVRHTPVLLDEVLAALGPKAGEVYVDGTFGAGGYTRALLDAASCSVIAVDRDPAAIAGGQMLVESSLGRLRLVHGVFGDLKSIVAAQGFTQVHGVVLDVGISSMQIDEGPRGFSFMRDGPLDMRMSQSGRSAADCVNELDKDDISRIIFVLGEDPRARSIARAIDEARRIQPFRTTFDLVRAVEAAVGPQRATDRVHPATRTFQALRVFVNGELSELAKALFSAEEILSEGGRLVVVTFHSLEDRIVKRFFTLRSGKRPSPSRHQIQSRDENEPTFQLLNRGHIAPTESEVSHNPRARSAKLRAGVRTSAAPWPMPLREIAVPELGRGLMP